MNRQDQHNRRSFILGLASLLPGFGVMVSPSFLGRSSFLSPSFDLSRQEPQTHLSIYTICINHLDAHLFSDYKDRVASCPFRDLILPDLGPEWIARYNRVRQFFINDRQLIFSTKSLNQNSTQVSFVNAWTSPQSFESYFKAAHLAELDSKFHAAGCSPSLHFHQLIRWNQRPIS